MSTQDTAARKVRWFVIWLRETSNVRGMVQQGGFVIHSDLGSIETFQFFGRDVTSAAIRLLHRRDRRSLIIGYYDLQRM